MQLSISFASTTPESDCTERGLKIQEKLSRDLARFRKRKVDAKVFKNYPKLLKETVFATCFDAAKAKRKNILWVYGLDFTNKTIDISQISSGSKNDFDFYVAHGYFNEAVELQKRNRELYELFSLRAPKFLKDKIKPHQKNMCTEVNISTGLPPIRDQDGFGWCNMYANADLLSFKLKKPVSASYLGLVLQPSGVGGAVVENISTLNQHYGFCSESTLPSNFHREDIAEAQTKMKNSVNNPSDCDRNGLENLFPAAVMNLVKQVFESNELKPMLILDPNVGLGVHDPEFSNSKITHAALKVCENDRKTLNIPNLQFQTVKASKQSALSLQSIDIVDEGLDQGKPVAVAYSYDGVIGSQSAEGGHSSVVVGRRFIDGKCQYS